MKTNDKIAWSHTAIRVLIGLMFALAGFNKLMDPSGITGLLSGIAVFAWAPGFWAWVLLLSELVFGLLLLVGYKVKYTAWPLALVMLVAWLTVVVGGSGLFSNPSFFHLVVVASLVMLTHTGPGKLAVGKN